MEAMKRAGQPAKQNRQHLPKHRRPKAVLPDLSDTAHPNRGSEPENGSVTSTETALQLLTRDLVRGVLVPGAKLKIRELIERYGLGATPMREALSQLASRGLVRLEANKGFRVAPVSRAHLIDITRTRQIVEGEALALAIAHGDDRWEEEIFTSFQLLKRAFDRRDSKSPEWLDDSEERHQRFHRALISACPMPTLLQFCDQLYTEMTRYRRMLKELGLSEKTGSGLHEELMMLVVARDTAKAVETLRRHIGLPAEALLQKDPAD